MKTDIAASRKFNALEDKSADRIRLFMKHHPEGTLATVGPDGEPHAAVIYYFVDDNFDICFTTKTGTKKYDNLMRNNHAMLVAFDALTQTTVQITGTTEEIRDKAVADIAFQKMINAAAVGSIAGVPPVSKLFAGKYVAMRLVPSRARMAVFVRPDSGGYDMYESLEFIP